MNLRADARVSRYVSLQLAQRAYGRAMIRYQSGSGCYQGDKNSARIDRTRRAVGQTCSGLSRERVFRAAFPRVFSHPLSTELRAAYRIARHRFFWNWAMVSELTESVADFTFHSTTTRRRRVSL